MGSGNKMMRRRNSGHRVPNSQTGLVSVTGTGWSVLVDANDSTGLVHVVRSVQEPVPDQSI